MTVLHRSGVAPAAACVLAAWTAWAQTDGNVTWNGEGASALWSDADNWVGDQYPTNPTPGTVSSAASEAAEAFRDDTPGITS